MSDTPRTDAEIIYPGSGIVMVRPEFARTLERELAAARQALEVIAADKYDFGTGHYAEGQEHVWVAKEAIRLMGMK